MDLSFIVPLYNQGKYLEECLQSIVDNKDHGLEYEIIVVDDCSTDDSFSVANGLQEKFTFRLYKNKKNSKPAATRNFAISKSTGTFIICLDSDDKIPTNYISETHKHILKQNVDVIYADSQCFGANMKRYNWPRFSLERMQHTPFVNCSSLFKRNLWETIGGFKEDMIYGWEDYEFWLNASKNGFKFCKCDTTELFYRQKETEGVSETANAKDGQIKINQLLKKYHNGFYLGA